MTNLKKQTANNQYAFRINLKAIHAHLSDLMDFPYAPPVLAPLSSLSTTSSTMPSTLTQPFLGPTLFLYGTKSGYVHSGSRHLIRQFFPQAEFVGINAGHW